MSEYYMNLPIINDDGQVEVREFDASSLPADEVLTSHMYLDSAEHYLDSGSPLGSRGGNIHPLSDYEDGDGNPATYVGGYRLVTSEDVLEDLYNEGEFNPAEDHSL